MENDVLSASRAELCLTSPRKTTHQSLEGLCSALSLGVSSPNNISSIQWQAERVYQIQL
jgi:hypothetical protein